MIEAGAQLRKKQRPEGESRMYGDSQSIENRDGPVRAKKVICEECDPETPEVVKCAMCGHLTASRYVLGSSYVCATCGGLDEAEKID